jgi:hypothetical protein
MDNQVRLQLFALAYNLGNFLRRLVLPKSVKTWSLRTLREKLIEIENSGTNLKPSIGPVGKRNSNSKPIKV